MIVTYPSNSKESNAIKAVLKALNIRYEIKEEPFSTKKQVLDNIKNGLEEVSKFKAGKLKTTLAKDFLNEL